MTALLDNVLSGLRRDLPGELGTAISVAHPSPKRGGGRLQVLAATGVGAVLPPITTGHLWGHRCWPPPGRSRWPRPPCELIRAGRT
ncbi:hypothetical protein [Amycolatopsis sp. YIM 10]|uniref:hypothetical protein n=1 Tax=Amycolatopsis sp. YIM 10 TaxID=2653857 RepID=UPI001D15651C|nr:hypothetical protein [Amycolatopsis sp. YIM 10]